MRTKMHFSLIKKKERGSIVLETSLILPILLLFVVFIVYFIKIMISYSALQMTTSHFTKQIASYAYPLRSFAEDRASPQILSLEKYILKFPKVLQDWTKQKEQQINKQIDHQLDRLKGVAWNTLKDTIHILPYINSNVLSTDAIKIVSLKIPHQLKKPYVVLELSYVFPLRVPFSNRNITLTAKTAERVWYGNTDETDTDKIKIEIISITPICAGKKATILARTAKYTRVQAKVYYKSGESIAKNLGYQASDAKGNISWTWHVSGNISRDHSIKVELQGPTTINVCQTVLPFKKEH